MSRLGDKQEVYFASPMTKRDGAQTVVIGYGKLRAYSLLCVPAGTDADIALYGEKVSQTIKLLHDDRFSTVNIVEMDGLWLNKPIPNEDGLFENPEYIVRSVRAWMGTTAADAQKRL